VSFVSRVHLHKTPRESIDSWCVSITLDTKAPKSSCGSNSRHLAMFYLSVYLFFPRPDQKGFLPDIVPGPTQ
jgi:hypothetical protein